MKFSKLLLFAVTGSALVTLFLFSKIHTENKVSAQSCTTIGYFCTSDGREWINYLEESCTDVQTGNTCTYDSTNQCNPQTTCIRGAICDCNQYCVFPNSLPVGQGCCGDRGSVCQSGLTCSSTTNVCTPPVNTATNTPTNTPTSTPPDKPGEDPESTEEAEFETFDNSDEYYEPSFSGILIQGMFFVITLAIIFSVIR